MDAAFTSIAFAEPTAAEANLERIEQRLPARLWAALPSLLAQVPDPDGALNYLERYLRAASPHILRELERAPAALHYLLVIFSYSRYLSETLIQQPELIGWLYRPPTPTGRSALERLKSPDDLHEEFARFSATAFDLPTPVVLARFKRREYLRIMLRDVLGLATLAETTLELSHLADVLLERALRICTQKLQNAYGTPQYTDTEGHRQTASLSVLSLGKLGGQELNYASDVDLMFLYSHDGETSGGPAGVVSNSEFFVRLAQAILRLVTEMTAEGAVFRVDLRLRPQGGEGDLAISLPAALHYYRNRAREWELQIKARCSAGDPAPARTFLREVQPLIFRHEFHLAAVEAVLNAREEMTRALRRKSGRTALPWNVKLSPGGIRDIEFLTQCLQRLYGGRDPWLVGPAAASTLRALGRLHDKGYLSGRDFFRLNTAYEFLRKVEHRLQLLDGLQQHTLPEDAVELEKLARRCGLEPAEGRSAAQQLLHRLQQHFTEVREIYQRLLAKPADSLMAESEPEAVRATTPGSALLRRLRREYPVVAESVQRLGESGADPHLRRGLDRFLSAAVLNPELMQQLAVHPDWLARAAELFARSDLLAEMFSRHAGEIALLADSEAAPADSPFDVPATAPLEEGMHRLRVEYRRRWLRVVARAVSGRTGPFETFAVLTGLAEQALHASLALAAAEMGRELEGGKLEQAPFVVLALGRLGSGEFDVASDADLVFVAEETLTAQQREPWRRLAERFVHVVSSHTREGLLFPVDTRLRPRGTEGDLVQSLAYVREYFAHQAQGWEAATYLKARPVAGNPELGATVVQQILERVRERFRNRARLAAELHHTRERLEREGTGLHAKGEFKKLSGGFYDIDYLLAFLFLTERAEPVGGNVLRQLATLEAAGLLSAEPAQTLRSAALLYRSIDHAVRLLTGHAASRLPEPAQAARVMRLLDSWGLPLAPVESVEAPSAAEMLENNVERARQQVRALYARIVLAAAS
jgi:glutamate-ammonia-ligase adenylyltransferase